MSRATFFKYWKVLEKSGAVRTTRQIGRATLYELDRQNDIVKQRIKLDATLARKSMEKAVEATVAIETRSNWRMPVGFGTLQNDDYDKYDSLNQ